MADAKDEKAKAAPAEAKAETKAEAKAAPAEKPVDIDALREQIRAEEAEKLRAESVARAEAEADRQAAIDAEKDNFDEVVCMIDNVHTTKGKMTQGSTKHLPKDEADELVAQKKVKRT